MGKKSKRISQATSEPAQPVELDVSGPLTLEEAKAVGDVPEDYQVAQEESLLQRATNIILGEKSEVAAVEGGEQVAAEETAEADVPADQKKVTFADEEEGAEEKVDQPRKKGFLGFLAKRKSHHASAEPAPEASEASAEEGAAAIETAEEVAAPEEAPKPKKKGFFSGLIHQKEKRVSEPAAEAEAAPAPEIEAESSEEPAVEEAETKVEAEGETEASAEDSPAAQEEAVEQAAPKKGLKGCFGFLCRKKCQAPAATESEAEPEVEGEGAAPEQAAADTSDTVESAPSEKKEKKRLFGMMFWKKSDSSAKDEPSADETAVTVADAEESAPAAETETEDQDQGKEGVAEPAEEAAAEPVEEAAAEPSKKKCCWWRRCACEQPAADAEVIKSDTLQVQSRFLKRCKARNVRLYSDGIFQYGKSEDFAQAKAVKLTSQMTVTSVDEKSKNPHILKLAVPNKRAIAFAFTSLEDRDAWAAFLADFKQRLEATDQDSGQVQVLKTSSIEEADEAAAAGTSQGAGSEEPTGEAAATLVEVESS